LEAAMTPERWRRIEQLYNAARENEAKHRAAFLAEVCGSDGELRHEVESLLDQEFSSKATLVGHRAADLFHNKDGLELTTRTQTGVNAGMVIDRYSLLQKIGEGGMGEVWLAEQREPVRRRVALKLVLAGMNTREVIARFESERQALALMDHPSIAKVFDAGSTSQGIPYFVMEYVAGVPITAYCDNHRLRTRERLELFIRVCEAVQHAHHKAIIHRDLKPSNVLVTEIDGRAAPKIIDFGVAKALAQKLTVETMLTRVGALVGTPEYMSPEQALSSGEDIDTRSDVYSLGIILYELLAGVRPLELRKIALDEFLRRLREEEPQKPSTRIRTQDPSTSTDVARKRQAEPQALVKQLRGDLDSIALKALEKDRSCRYASPSDLGADIGRYLRNEAVLAVRPSAAYRARKFARRYRAALITTAAFVLVLVTAAGISIRQSIRANREAAVSQAVSDFLQKDLLAQASAATQSGLNAKPDPDLKVRTTLDRAAARIGGKFDRQPEVEAAIRDTIAQTYLDLGLYPQAGKQFERALELHRRTLGPENPKTLKTTSRLGRALYLQAKNSEAEALFGQALKIQQRVLGAQHADTLYSMTSLASVSYSQGHYQQAEALYGQILEIQRRVLGPEHPDIASSMYNLANVYSGQGKYAQAEALDKQSLDIRRRVLGPEHPETLNSMVNLANDYEADSKFAQAEALFSDTLEIQRRVLGPEHPGTLHSMSGLANIYFSQGKYAQAETLYHQTLEIRRRVLGPEHFSTLVAMNNLADVLECSGQYTRAEALFKQTLEISRRVLAPDHPLTLAVLEGFASMYQRKGQYALAEIYAAQTLTGRRRALGSEHPDTMASAADLALAYISQGKFADSEPLVRGALEFYGKKQPDDWQRFRAESLLGAGLAGQKRYVEAEPMLLEAYHGMTARKDKMSAPDSYHLERAREWIVQLYQAWGKPEKTAGWRKK
jgi:tetratricopeptide (TPR) repeat protein